MGDYIIMNNLENIISKLVENKSTIKKKYKIKQIGVFGSFVRGENQKNSDIDILIEYDRRKTFTIFDFIRLEEYLTGLLGIKVDLALKSKLKPVIGSYIMKEVIMI